MCAKPGSCRAFFLFADRLSMLDQSVNVRPFLRAQFALDPVRMPPVALEHCCDFRVSFSVDPINKSGLKCISRLQKICGQVV